MTGWAPVRSTRRATFDGRCMTPAEAALRRAASDLDALSGAWALVGGLALAARVEPRFTRDVDTVVAVPSDDAAETLVFDLSARGYTVGAIVEQEAVGRLSTARLQPPVGGAVSLFVDLLFASSGIEGEIVRDADRIEVLPGLRLPVARVGHLIALKLLAMSDQRPQDAFDLENLRATADDTELDLAREAISLIDARGFNRGRDLRALFKERMGKDD
jgi:predicted nucleotidyltransferase